MDQGKTALIVAAQAGHEPIVRILVERREAPGFVLAIARLQCTAVTSGAEVCSGESL